MAFWKRVHVLDELNEAAKATEAAARYARCLEAGDSGNSTRAILNRLSEIEAGCKAVRESIQTRPMEAKSAKAA